jgi:hypothetical protein
MDLFRSQPSLCSLFLSLLEEWGAETLDWSLLRDEVFVDRFLRRLLVAQQLDETSIFQACSSLLQPSVGGLLVAPLLARGGHFEAGEMDSFVAFAVQGKAQVWDPMSWPELLTVLEEVAFTRQEEPARFLASMMANGWVPAELRGRFTRRVWETSQLTMREKNFYFAWLGGESRWGDVPSPEASYDAQKLRLGRRLRHLSEPFQERRRGISATGKEAIA